MPDFIPCTECHNEIPQPSDCCPHCAQPNLFWNVLKADQVEECTALDERYHAAKADAFSRSADGALQKFEDALRGSTAVIACSETEMQRLANHWRQVYRTYYQQIDERWRLPDNDEWSTARQLADTLLFTDYWQHIRFAALSLDGTGLSKFGQCSFELRDDLIAHRASVLEENAVIFMERHDVGASRKAKVPKGYRASWASRSKVCVAKLAGTIDSTTAPNEYSGLLLKQGASRQDDEFVEVHIYGPITILTMTKVTVTTPKVRQRATIVRALKSKLAKHGVSVS